MGNTKSLKSEDWNSLQRVTGLPMNELKALHKEFYVGFPNGKMSKSDYLQLNSRNQASEEFISIIFDSFDKDNNGYIDFQEYAIVIGIKKNGTLDDKINLAFKMFDIDGNGIIEYKEMLQLMASLFRMVASRTHENDVFYLSKMEEQAKEKVDQIFKEMDTNGDGVLSFDEFKAGCEKDSEISTALLRVGSI